MTDKTEVQEVQEEKKKYTTVSHSSLTISNNPLVATHHMDGGINEKTATDFRKFLESVFEHNKKIDDDERERKEQNEFNQIHDPEAKPKFVATKRKVERINLVINSHGGSVMSMLNIVALMKNSSIPIDTYCFGAAMSAGFYIFIHGKRRYVTDSVSLMIHSVASGSWDNVPNMKIAVSHLDRLNKDIQAELIKKTGLTAEWIEKNEHIDSYFNGTDAIDNKIADILIKD